MPEMLPNGTFIFCAYPGCSWKLYPQTKEEGDREAGIHGKYAHNF